MEHKKVSSNPARLLKRLKESDGRVRFLNQHVPDEEARLRKVIAAKFPEHLPELDIAVNTGMRRSEQYCRISWACVDLERQDLFVPKSKNGRARHIPLNDAALAAFRKLHGRTRGQGPIFEHLKKGEKGKSLLGPRHWFEDAISEAGIKDFTWHDLRHTFASRLVMQGVPLRAVAELLGHRSIQMTMEIRSLGPRRHADSRKKTGFLWPETRSNYEGDFGNSAGLAGCGPGGGQWYETSTTNSKRSLAGLGCFDSRKHILRHD